MSTGSNFYDLLDRDGEFTAPVHVEASWLLHRLGQRDIAVTVDGADLVVSPKGALTDTERADLIRLKRHVRTLLAYTAPGVH